jgi:alpha-tubulin suppressor-like RCC1 family protein
VRAFLMLVLATSVVGCITLLGVDGYRNCANDTECSGGDASIVNDAAGDNAADAAVDAQVPPTLCTTGVECPSSAPACSQGMCAAVQSLVRGTTSYQCAILVDQSLWCWGANDHGQLGRGYLNGPHYLPQPVTLLPKGARVLQAGMSNDMACALLDDGSVRCWGDGINAVAAAVSVTLPASAVELSEGSASACARLSDKRVYCWGHNDRGDVGCANDGDGGLVANSIAPQSPQMLADANADIAHVSVGYQATCLNKANSDQVFCYGNSAWGNLANGITGNDTSCQTGSAKNYGATIVRMDSGDFATCEQDANGKFFCWGVNYSFFKVGLLSPDEPLIDSFSIPTAMPYPNQSGRKTVNVTVGWKHSCALLSNDEVICWGDSELGQTGQYSGLGTTFTTVLGLKGVRDIAAHRHFTCALQNDGQVLCWGANGDQVIGPIPPLPNSLATPTVIKWH